MNNILYQEPLELIVEMINDNICEIIKSIILQRTYGTYG